MLVFLSEWLSRDLDRLAASLAEFVGHPAYGLNELHGDWNGLCSCSAAATTRNCSAYDQIDVPASRRRQQLIGYTPR
jgi:hypothetical protein